MRKTVNKKNFAKFFEWSKKYLKENKKELRITKYRTMRLSNGDKCQGWCDGNTLAVASGGRKFEETYCHEFSHITQSVEDIQLWQDYLADPDCRSSITASWDSIMSVAMLERDCEIRSLNFSNKWGLFNSEVYAQETNLYLFYHQYLFLRKKWINTSTIYRRPLIKLMPKKIITAKTLSKIDMNLMLEFDKHLKND